MSVAEEKIVLVVEDFRRILLELEAAALQFRSYETSHRLKGTEEAFKKADVNQECYTRLMNLFAYLRRNYPTVQA